jgi:hypothetical protein
VYLNREHLELIKRWLRVDSNPDPALAPYSSQLEYVRDEIGKRKVRLLLSGLETYWRFIDLDQRFDNTRLLTDTRVGMSEPAHDYLKRASVYLDQIDPLAAAINP